MSLLLCLFSTAPQSSIPSEALKAQPEQVQSGRKSEACDRQLLCWWWLLIGGSSLYAGDGWQVVGDEYGRDMHLKTELSTEVSDLRELSDLTGNSHSATNEGVVGELCTM